MHPDRNTHLAVERTESDREELIIYGLLIVIGALPVAIALVRRAIFGFDATFGLLMVLVGLVGVVVRLRPSRRK
ncbi:MAG TPA: hypothetical protein VFQ65_01165 [Kofleriaceae bacterium]|nr:hypothetical protein [Kofleriaceae bacterium]